MNLIKSLRLDSVGWLELIFAAYPIFTVYRYPYVPFSLLMLILMDIIALHRKKRKIMNDASNKVLKLLFGYVLIHEFLLMFVIGVPGVMISKYIEYIIIFTSIFIIYPRIDINKLEGSINWIAIVSMIGLVYHFVTIKAGGPVYPLRIPFLPEMDKASKIYVTIERPTSFYYEPQHYCSFMLIPLFLSLVKKGTLIWPFIIVLSMFLSTSSYGIIVSILMFAIYAFSQKMSVFKRILIMATGAVLVILLLFSSLFESGVDKIENTDVERASRLYNGPMLLMNLKTQDMFLGVPDISVSDYYFHGGVGEASLIEKDDNVYLPSIYLILAKFGIVCLILYLLTYFLPILRCRDVLYLSIPLFTGLFVNPDSLGSQYAFYMIFIYSYSSKFKVLKKKRN